LQQAAGYSPLAAGAALIPMTVIMLAVSARVGRIAAKDGPRLPLTLRSLLAGLGFLLLLRVGAEARFAPDVLPAVVVFGLGMAITVAPLTSTVLAAGGEQHAGVSSAVNNDVARVAGLLAVAVVPLVAGLSGASYQDPHALTDGVHSAVMLCGVLCISGGALAWATIRRPAKPPDEADSAFSCALGAPPLRRRQQFTSIDGSVMGT
jgi:hypothetical protein